ncbi:uncharacterized protein [Henckelia pumila]|uniref:uncharacterized protein n=1 Tax=Henckelia pumila TaxID=405737 RepID=UPI003C6E93F7
MKPHGVTEEQIQLRAFPFSLKNAAKDWLYYLPPGSMTTWTEMKRIFQEKYFPASRAANIRKYIYDIMQFTGESLHEYWEWFKKLCASCPQHQITENLLIQYFYEGNGQTAKACGICVAVVHATDMCLTLQEDSVEQVNATSRFPGPPQRKYDPYSNTYNPGWKDHPNLRYGNPQANQPGPQAQPHNQAYRPQKREQNEDVKESKVEENELNHEDTPRGKFPPLSKYKPVAHFSLALKDSRKDEGIKGLYETFHRCEGCKKVELGEQVSAVIWRKTPEKCKDLGMFSIPCKIGDVQLDTAMLDLGASINVLPYSVYASLKLRSLNETATVIQMADKSTIYPRRVIEVILVQVGNLVFPADFYVLDKTNNDFKSPIC